MSSPAETIDVKTEIDNTIPEQSCSDQQLILNFFEACRTGDIDDMDYWDGIGLQREIVLTCLQTHVNPRFVGDWYHCGQTAAHVCAKYGQSEALLWILKDEMWATYRDRDQYLCTQNAAGETAFDVAILCNQPEIIKILLFYSDIKTFNYNKDIKYRTQIYFETFNLCSNYLHLSMISNFPELFKFLCNLKEVDINKRLDYLNPMSPNQETLTNLTLREHMKIVNAYIRKFYKEAMRDLISLQTGAINMGGATDHIIKDRLEKLKLLQSHALGIHAMTIALNERQIFNERDNAVEIALCLRKISRLPCDKLGNIAEFLLDLRGIKKTADAIMTEAQHNIDKALIKVKHAQVKKPAQLNWGRVAVMIAFVRANENSPLKYSILGLLHKFGELTGNNKKVNVSSFQKAPAKMVGFSYLNLVDTKTKTEKKTIQISLIDDDKTKKDEPLPRI